MMRSAASSGAMVASSRAASASVRARDELDLVLGVELLEHVGLELAVLADGLDDLLALVVRRRLDEVGDLGGVEPGQLAVGDAQARRGDVGDEGLDARPVHDLAGGDATPQRTGREPAQGHTGARVDPHDLPAPVDAGELDLVGPDEPGPLEVDQVPGSEVASTAGARPAAARSAAG